LHEHAFYPIKITASMYVKDMTFYQPVKTMSCEKRTIVFDFDIMLMPVFVLRKYIVDVFLVLITEIRRIVNTYIFLPYER